MANIKSAKKRAKQAEKQRMANKYKRSRAYTLIRKAFKAISDGKPEEAKTSTIQAISEIDRMINKGIFHKNKAARLKSRLNAKLKQLAA